MDWQKIRIQELSRDVPAEDIGRIPRFADVEVEGTLCDACRGGDIVTIVGIADILNVEAKGSALERERAAKQYNVYVKGISIRKRDSDAGGAPPLSAAAAEAFARGLPDLVAEDAHFGRVNEGWLGQKGFRPDVVDNTTFSPRGLGVHRSIYGGVRGGAVQAADSLLVSHDIRPRGRQSWLAPGPIRWRSKDV